MEIQTAIASLLLFIGLINEVGGHGYLWKPPGRSVAYRAGYNIAANYNHMGLNCGGFGIQFGTNGGNCGVCGDNYADQEPRENEAGGKYALTNRTVTGTYVKGGVLKVQVNITSHHKGFFVFRLYANNNFSRPVTQEQLDSTVLTLKGTTETNFYITDDVRTYYDIELQLPAHLECSQCVLQWNYTTGNSWNNWPGYEGCLGCGPQETFINCADIAIVSTGSSATSTSSSGTPTPQSSTMSVLMSSSTPRTTRNSSSSDTTVSEGSASSSSTPSSTDSLTQSTTPAQSSSSSSSTYSSTESSTQSTPSVLSSSISSSTPSSTDSSTQPTTQALSSSSSSSTPSSTASSTQSTPSVLSSSSSSSTSSPTDSSTQSTTGTLSSTKTKTTTESSSLPSPSTNSYSKYCTVTTICTRAVDICNCDVTPTYAGQAGMKDWCITNCKAGFCPSTHCAKCYC